METWDDDFDNPPSSNKITENGIAPANGFYVGRGRGFGNLGSLSNSLPQVGAQSNFGFSNAKSEATSGNSNFEDDWDDSMPVSEKKGSGWDDEPARAGNDSWNNRGGKFGGGGTNKNRFLSKGSSDFKQDLNGYQNSKSKFSKGSTCYKCNEEGHMARDCTSTATGSRGGGRTCYNCGDSGHMSKDCPSKGSSDSRGGGRNCYNCGESGHMSRDCPNKESGGGGGGRNCYNCGESGHMSKDCPNKESGGGGGRNCYNCGESGHMSKDCPSKESGSSNRTSKGCFNCGKEGHMSRDCPEERSSKPNTCFKCHEEGHMARDCTKEVLGEDGKPRPPPYIPPELTSDDAETLFQGVPTGINFSKYDQIHVDVTGSNSPPPIHSFESSGLCQHLLGNIKHSQYLKPTPVQKYAIPIIMQKRDLMACAQTGSGKTAAFLLPILNEMIPNPDLPNNANQDVQKPWAVILAPTRELVIQICSEARKFAHDSVVKADLLYGGTSVSCQSNRIKRGCHLLVATPGRLLDFLGKGKISFSELRYLVLDEADRMLDMGFAANIREAVEHESMPEKGVRRTLMFSATFPEDIQRMAADYLDNYLFLTVGMVGAANADVQQSFFSVGQFDKREKLLEILKESGSDRTLVFVEQKRTADFIASLCSQHNIPTTSIHGDRLQREREEALRDFRSGKMPVLVATAVAARGLDIRDVRHVINYDLPQTIDEYVHRIGRTGRVGNLGKATSFYDSSVDQPLARSLKKILIDAEQEVPDWLSEEANQACGTAPFGGRGAFGSRDVRSRGRGKKFDSDNAFDNNFDQPASTTTTSFQNPISVDDDWD